MQSAVLKPVLLEAGRLFQETETIPIVVFMGHASVSR